CCSSLSRCLFLSLMLCFAPCSTLFPYTTLFRSPAAAAGAVVPRHGPAGDGAAPVRLGRRRRGARLDRAGPAGAVPGLPALVRRRDRKSTRLNSSHVKISYAVFCLKKKNISCSLL